MTQKADEEPTTPRIKVEHSITKSDSIIVPGMDGVIAKQSEKEVSVAKEAEIVDVVTLRQYSYQTPHIQLNQRIQEQPVLLLQFKQYVVLADDANELTVLDTNKKITAFKSNIEGRLLSVCVDAEFIYYLVFDSFDEKTVKKLVEYEDNRKIMSFMDANLFHDAEDIAKDSKFPPQVFAEIARRCGDYHYERNNLDEAIRQYMATIGFLNPSYVIERFCELPKLDFLIQHLEKLKASNDRSSSQVMAEYNKDFIELLLNCYVKKNRFDAIHKFVFEECGVENSEKAFNLDTVIEVCRRYDSTRSLAIQLAQQQHKWELLVKIRIDDEENWHGALEIIKRHVLNVQKRVKLL